MDFTVDETLDACGLLCPEPVMMLHNKMRDINAGQILEVIATDPSTVRDIPKFCNFLGHRLLEQAEREKTFVYYIQKC
jgi:tRNA 2-thiouridine synthesizing protein A